MQPLDLTQLFASPFFVGGAGALVSLKFVPGEDWWKRLTNWACGALVAGYCAPPLTNWLRLSEGDLLGVAFFLGLLGLSVVNAIVRGIGELRLAEIITGWFGRSRGRNE